jgi:threonine dehydrogenase-like Zn-dependent dehydrogenase
MKKAVIVGMRQAARGEVPQPKAKENWAVVKVHAAPMCTEYKSFLSGGPAEFLGHEAAGEVVEVAQPGRVKGGDRVVGMPRYACGECALCQSGDYIHCEHNPDMEAFLGTREGRPTTYAQYLIQAGLAVCPRSPTVCPTTGLAGLLRHQAPRSCCF